MFRENCVVFHRVLLCRTYKSIPFTWRDICNTSGNASIECDPVLHKALCKNHYQLVYRFVNANKVHTVFCEVCEFKHKHENTLQKRSLYHVLTLPLWSPSSEILLDFKANYI